MIFIIHNTTIHTNSFKETCFQMVIKNNYWLNQINSSLYDTPGLSSQNNYSTSYHLKYIITNLVGPHQNLWLFSYSKSINPKVNEFSIVLRRAHYLLRLHRSLMLCYLLLELIFNCTHDSCRLNYILIYSKQCG